jgi:hypothetical protein
MALAHGGEALLAAILLPVAVVPFLFLLSLPFWRAAVATKVLTGVVLVLVGAALLGVNLLLLGAVAALLRDAPFIAQILAWYGPPIAAQAAAWALIARWRRRAGSCTTSTTSPL